MKRLSCVLVAFAAFAGVMAANAASDYLVIDLSAGPAASLYATSHLSAVPAKGWTDEYKTTKLVLRRIPAGAYTMGSPTNEVGRDSDEPTHQVKLEQDFYIAVFETTQRQWERVMGSWPSHFANANVRDTRPVEQVSYGDIRGPNAGAGWPVNNSVDADSFMGRLRARTGIAFDLPTETQWEYAGRAGTAQALDSGKDPTSTTNSPDLAAVGRYYYNGGSNGVSDPGCGVAFGTAAVGSYSPNAWDLYDMQGNVCEWCLDWWYGIYPDKATASKGGDRRAALFRVARGGSWFADAVHCRIAYRNIDFPTDSLFSFGFRIAAPVTQKETPKAAPKETPKASPKKK